MVLGVTNGLTFKAGFSSGGTDSLAVELDIIPGDAEALADFIMNKLGRGVSSIEVTGEYTQHG